jgi:ubiquitin thioesterase protein OTUB1
MYQPEPTAYLQVSTGYAMPQGLPDYTFEETPLRLSDAARGSVAAGAGANDAGALLFGTPLFSANSAGVGPATSAAGSFPVNFHPTSSSSATAAASTVSAPPSHHRPSLPLLLKMEATQEDLVAQEAAAREYQPQLQVMTLLTPGSFLAPFWYPHNEPLLTNGFTPASQGPLVGKKTPSTAITEEYAKADPVYVQKTLVGD